LRKNVWFRPMTPKEIILAALRGEKPGRVPVALVGGGMWSVRDYGVSFRDLSRDAPRMASMLVEMAEKLRSDIVYAGSGFPNFPVAALGGRIIFRDIGTPDLEAPIVSSEGDLDRLDVAALERDPVLAVVREALMAAQERIGNEYVVSLTSWGPFTLGARLIGEEAMMKALVKRPAFVGKVLGFTVGMLIRFYEAALRDGKLRVLLVGEPTASGDLISRRQFETFVVPHLRTFTDWARSLGGQTILHVCGNTTDRLDLFPLTGASCISLDHKTDMSKAKEALQGKMCFAGNIDPVKILLQGTAADVETVCRRTIAAAGTDGGFILMPGCDIPPTVPYENIRVFTEVARSWRL
jgi:uroporphyrinogen decarboxylase